MTVSPRSRRSCARLVKRLLTALGCVALAASADSGASAQNDVASGQGHIEWPEETVGLLRNFFERVDVESVLDGVRAPRAARLDDSVSRVVARLDPTWEAPFRFVSESIAYEPYPGSVRGARGTLLAGAGNSLDQAVLLAELLRARGQRARLVRGSLRWDAAVRLVGDAKVDRAERGDPWLRWVEMASDHWWVEAQRAGSWVELDPSFGGSSVGQTFGRRRQVADGVPRRAQAIASVEVLLAGTAIEHVTLPASELVGSSVLLLVHKELEAEDHQAGGEAAAVERAPTGVMLPEAAPADPLASVFPVLPEGPPRLDLQVAGRISQVDLGSAADLSRIALRVGLRTALGGVQDITMAWHGGFDGRLFVLVHPGGVRPELLRRVVAPVYELLTDVVSAELDALQAYEARPQADPEALDGILAGATRSRRAPRLPPPGFDAGESDSGVDVPLHPADSFHVALLRAWLRFEQEGLPALATTYLAAIDRLRPNAPLVGTGVRLLGISWSRPTLAQPGNIAVWSAEPVSVGGLDDRRRRGLQGAFGLLESALLGHVLNGFADSPPTTAFDVTLRSVGSGSRLAWWRRGERPGHWSPFATAAAARVLGEGYTVIGPRSPLSRQGRTVLGWWVLAPRSGSMTGMVEEEATVAQGAVDFTDSGDLRDLGSLLVSVRDLHRASRWLLAAADPETDTLAELLPRACAATSLVGELLVAGAPKDWQPPLFAGYCAAGRSAP